MTHNFSDFNIQSPPNIVKIVSPNFITIFQSYMVFQYWIVLFHQAPFVSLELSFLTQQILVPFPFWLRLSFSERNSFNPEAAELTTVSVLNLLSDSSRSQYTLLQISPPGTLCMFLLLITWNVNLLACGKPLSFSVSHALPPSLHPSGYLDLHCPINWRMTQS